MWTLQFIGNTPKKSLVVASNSNKLKIKLYWLSSCCTLNQQGELDLEPKPKSGSGFYSVFIIIIFCDLSDWCHAGILIAEKGSTFFHLQSYS